jgi:HEPN domain-containing protein
MAKADFLQKRAEDFLKDGEIDIKEGRWNVAAFHFGEVCQLYLKYYLFLKLKDFPKTHSLDELLTDLGRAYKKEKEVERIKRKNLHPISDLNQAYITSRYLPVEFSKTQVEGMRKFTKELIKFLKKL